MSRLHVATALAANPEPATAQVLLTLEEADAHDGLFAAAEERLAARGAGGRPGGDDGTADASSSAGASPGPAQRPVSPEAARAVLEELARIEPQFFARVQAGIARARRDFGFSASGNG